MPANHIQAIIFDFDGLIMDTELPEFRAWEEVYADHGQALGMKEWATVIGSSYEAFNPLDHLAGLTGGDLDREAVTAAKLLRQNELLQGLEPLPGVREYVRDAGSMGIRLAVASSSPRYWVEDHLRESGLLPSFEALVTREDVSVVKPAPDLFLAALKALGVDAQNALAIEDSPNGVTSARAAGLFAVAVPNTLTRLMDLSHADLTIPSLADVPLAELLDRVPART